jgi:DNA-binding transcriptional ArsR family regulator
MCNYTQHRGLTALQASIHLHIILAQREGGMKDADLLFKALADPTRRKLLDLLYANDAQTLSELERKE